MWLIKLEETALGKTAWFAVWSGDPGRTYDKSMARGYRTEAAAKCALTYILKHYPWRSYKHAEVVMDSDRTADNSARGGDNAKDKETGSLTTLSPCHECGWAGWQHDRKCSGYIVCAETGQPLNQLPLSF